MMNKDLERAKRKVKKKLSEAVAKGDFVRQAHLLKELKDLERKELVMIQTSLQAGMSAYSAQERKKATVEIIYTIAIADMLSGAIMDVLGILRKHYNIADVPILSQMQKITKYYQQVVKTIDDLGSELFSNNYMEIAEKVEEMCSEIVKTKIHELMMTEGIEKL